MALPVLSADDKDLSAVQAAIGLGFADAGMAVGSASEIDRVAAERGESADHQDTRDSIAAGRFVLAGAFGPRGAVGGGGHSPRGSVTEITGVATLSSYRRRGIASAVTTCLIADARERGMRTIFLSADSEQVAHIYAGIGFHRIGTACIAEDRS